MPNQDAASHEQDLNFAQSVLSVNSAAAAKLRSQYHGRPVAVLCARGANATEAEDLVADIGLLPQQFFHLIALLFRAPPSCKPGDLSRSSPGTVVANLIPVLVTETRAFRQSDE